MTDLPTPPANPYAAIEPMNPSDEKLWATLIHIGGIILGFLPAVIGYLVLRDRGPFIRSHTAAALNFQLTILIVYVVGTVLTLVFIGLLIVIAAGVLSVVFSILAAIAANEGKYYRYPLTITFVN